MQWIVAGLDAGARRRSVVDRGYDADNAVINRHFDTEAAVFGRGFVPACRGIRRRSCRRNWGSSEPSMPLMAAPLPSS